MEKRLYRNTHNKMVGGVCSGLADYFNIDPVLVRLLFVILTLHQGLGVLAYIILWIVVPARFEPAAAAEGAGAATAVPDEMMPGRDTASTPQATAGKGSLYGGIVLIVIGMLFLLDNFIPGFGFEDFWPLLLIAVGGGMLWNSWPQRNEDEEVLS
ncbi:MAG: PspC domain-containing protein [Bacteroidota bacterium]|nr:PspC domain-containing protein [Bacteroidota bacterium]